MKNKKKMPIFKVVKKKRKETESRKERKKRSGSSEKNGWVGKGGLDLLTWKKKDNDSAYITKLTERKKGQNT